MDRSVKAGHPANNFDFWRVLAATMVLFSHQFALMGMPEPLVTGRVTWGTLGVCIFFAISGFLVTQSWQGDPNVPRFVQRRFLRIWPGLLVVTLLTALVMGPLISTVTPSEYFRSADFASYFRTLFLSMRYKLPGVFAGNPYPDFVNASLWTIPLEVRWYIVVLVAGVIGLLRWRFAALAGTAALGIYHFGIYGAEANPLLNMTLEFGLFFVYGACLYLFRDWWMPRMSRCLLVLIVIALAVAAAGHPYLAIWLALPPCVVAFGLASTPVICRFGRFGDISYGLYIYAFPVQQFFVWKTGGKLGYPATLALCASVTTALAFASWHWVERPALRLKPARKSKPTLDAQGKQGTIPIAE